MSTMNTKHISRDAGFTLIELLIAMAVFSFMLMIISTSFIGIIHITQSGTASRNSQQSARLIMDTIERQMQASQRVTVLPPNSSSGMRLGRLCLYTGGNYVEYAVDAAPSNSLRMGIITAAQFTTCASPAVIPAAWSKLNDGATSVRRFVPSTSAAVGSDGGTANLELTLSGNGVNTSELTPDMKACKPGQGSQFCSVTTLVTTAELRGGTNR